METGLTEIDLANFTGRGADYYGGSSFVLEALAQAGDLLEIATGLSTLPPETSLYGRLARRGVLAMADAIFEGNKYRDLRHSPFRSETIGSYTYSLAEGNVLAGIPTGISWFDLAVDRLRGVLQPGVSNSSIAAFPRPGDLGELEGSTVLIGPADTERFRQGWQHLAEGRLPD